MGDMREVEELVLLLFQWGEAGPGMVQVSFQVKDSRVFQYQGEPEVGRRSWRIWMRGYPGIIGLGGETVVDG